MLAASLDLNPHAPWKPLARPPRLRSPKRPPVPPLFPELEVDLDELLQRFRRVAEEDALGNPTGYVEEALPVLLHLVPRYALGLRRRGRLKEEVCRQLALAAWRRLYGTQAPGDHGVSPDLLDYFARLLNTARLLLLAFRASPQKPSPSSPAPGGAQGIGHRA